MLNNFVIKIITLENLLKICEITKKKNGLNTGFKGYKSESNRFVTANSINTYSSPQHECLPK